MQKLDTADSSEFRIFETDEFQRKLNQLPLNDSRFVQQKLTEYAYPQLRKDPVFCLHVKKLKGYSPETWRYRIGKFRVFYCINQAERIIAIVSVDDRRDAY